MARGEQRWRKLEVWKLADELAFRVYQETRSFPREEAYGLTTQVRKASLSVPTNVVEGYSRRGKKDLARFIDIALGSLGEAEYLIYFSNRLGFLNDRQRDDLEDLAAELGGKLWRFYEKVRVPATGKS